MVLKFRKLRADEIDARVGMVKKDKGFTLLLYKDARVDMSILDETLGAFNWQRDHKELKGNIYCDVSIWDNEKSQWITKWDCGTESNTEKEKGEASDSFKRACTNIGIGRELYTSPFIWIKGAPTDYNGFKVTNIEYAENGDILNVEIQGKSSDGWKVIFSTKNVSKKPSKKENCDQISEALIEELNKYNLASEKSLEALRQHFNVEYLTDKEIEETIIACKKKYGEN